MDANESTALAANLAARVRDAIADAGLTQREVAESANIPLATLNRRLNAGAASPLDAIELASLARVLGLDASALVRQAEDAA